MLRELFRATRRSAPVSRLVALVAAAAAGSFVPATQAAVIQMTNGTTRVNGAEFVAGPVSITDSASDALVRLQDKNHDGIETGFNAPGIESVDTKPGSRALRMAEMLPVKRGGQDFYALMLDVNEPQGGGKNTISLDELKLYMSSDALTKGAAPSSLGSPVWNLDGAGSTDLMLADKTNGMGKADLALYLPAAAFRGAGSDEYVYVYSRFSSAEGGFESWLAPAVAVPEPAGAMVVAGGAIAGLVVRRRK